MCNKVLRASPPWSVNPAIVTFDESPMVRTPYEVPRGPGGSTIIAPGVPTMRRPFIP
jgi:hypothetical protein